MKLTTAAILVLALTGCGSIPTTTDCLVSFNGECKYQVARSPFDVWQSSMAPTRFCP